MPTDCLRSLTFRRAGQLTLVLAALFGGAGAASAQTAAPLPRIMSAADASRIAAVVNGDVISYGDIDARRRLFAVSVGLPMSPDVLDRLTAQVTRSLIDERLRLQEMQRRKVVVQDAEIAEAIIGIERRNNMPPGTLKRQLAGAGLNLRSMIDQYRVQIGWTRVLHDTLGPAAEPSPSDVAEREARLKAVIGQTEYEVGEIFIPIAEPNQAAEAQRFADLVIQQLRAGAPFPVVAAQFSQAQTALQGGDLGWVQAPQLDDEVVPVVNHMPVGAVSNPVRVPGGVSIVALRGRREIGKEMAMVASIRQVLLPFASALNPNAPTDEQRKAIDTLRTLSGTLHACDGMEAAAAKVPGAKYSATPDVRVEGIGNPALRQLVATLPIERASEALIAQDGVAVMMVCSRDTRNVGLPSKKELESQLFVERMELLSRQLIRSLQRRAVIDQRA